MRAATAALVVVAACAALFAGPPKVRKVDKVAPATSTEPVPEVSVGTPEPPQAATPTPRAGTASPREVVGPGTVPWSKVRAAISAAFGRGLAPRMEAIARCETGGSYEPATDIGAAGEVGILQIHPGWWTRWPSRSAPLVASMGYTRDDLFDPTVNAEVGFRIYQAQGLQAWTCA